MIEIHEAKEADAAGLLAIYAPYVEHTAITFEYETPSITEFRQRIKQTLKRYPYLAADENKVSISCCQAGWKGAWVCVCRAVSCQRSVCMGG